MGSYSRISVFSVFLFLLLLVSFPWVGAVDEADSALGLADAEEALVSAYNAVLEAEDAGANVSGLLVRLNVGGEYLAEAYVWYRLGAYENASRLTGLCHEAVGDVRSEAVGLKDEAVRLGDADFVMRLVGSVVGVVIVVILGFVVWRAFRRRYNKQVSRLKPEVVSDES